jgi:hypothetical protein
MCYSEETLLLTDNDRIVIVYFNLRSDFDKVTNDRLIRTVDNITTS